MKNYRIVRVTIDDIPKLAELVNSAYRGETSKQGWTTEAELLDGIRTDEASLIDLLQTPGVTILKYVTNNNELGGCVYLHKQERKLYLGMLTVSPEIQTQGIGKRLMLAAEQFAKENDCDKIEITVITVRNELLSWYERRGFNKTGETKPFPDDPRFGIPKQPLAFAVMEKAI